MEWIKTNTFDLAARRGKKACRIDPHVFLSPYDVPNAVRTSTYKDKIVIEFRYINIMEDKKIHEGKNDGVLLEVGVSTKRLYKVILDRSVLEHFDEHNLRALLPLKSAVDDFVAHQENISSNTAKYSAALSAISDNYEYLSQGI
jgi:hypothetical protein